jgi:hypothetical protein
MVPAMPTQLPIVAEPSVDRLVRVLSWIYRRDDETVSCRLALTADCSAYELRTQSPWNPARASVELFDDALSAFERQTAIERGLMNVGFTLETFDSMLEVQTSA